MPRRGGLPADKSRAGGIDTARVLRQVKHLILAADPRDPRSWRNPSSAPSASAPIAAPSFTTWTKIRSPARSATPSWKRQQWLHDGRGRTRRQPPFVPPLRGRPRKRWWRRRPPRPNSFRSKRRTRNPRARKARARRRKEPRKRWSSRTSRWTTPPSSRSRRRATRTSPTSSATARRRRRVNRGALVHQTRAWVLALLDPVVMHGLDPRIHQKNRLIERAAQPRYIHNDFGRGFPDPRIPFGAIAQLGERLNGIQEVGGSTPPGS